MSRGVPLSRTELHDELWAARDRSGKVKIYQKQLAIHLGISQSHMSRVITDMEAQGRIKKIGARYRNVGIYLIRDPAEFPFTSVTGLSK